MAEPVLDPRNEQLKRLGAGLSLGYNVTLTSLKVVAAVLTGSMSLLSEAVHSGTDVVASFVAFLSVRAASRPPDAEHPYGHGKIESLTGLGEAVLLLLIVFYIFGQAVSRLVSGEEVRNLNVGLWVMGFSAVTSFVTGRYVSRIGKDTESIALRSNGQHLMVDFWTSVGVLLALGITKFTGWQQADSWFALALALWIAFGAMRMSKEAVDVLIDRSMPDEDVLRVRRILDAEGDCISYHRLRTRTSGHVRYIEVHIVVPREWSVIQAHDLADSLEKKIQSELAPAFVVIHVDPYDYAKAAVVDDTESANG